MAEFYPGETLLKHLEEKVRLELFVVTVLLIYPSHFSSYRYLVRLTD